jgi:hypothetical protein
MIESTNDITVLTPINSLVIDSSVIPRLGELSVKNCFINSVTYND